MGPAEACALHAAAIVDGGPFRRFVAARAERLLRLAAHAAPELRVTEPRALAAVCLALLRYADGFIVGPGAEGTFPVLPWSEADAATHPRRADDAAAYAAFVSARERRSRGDRTADAAGEAALEAYADALDRRAAQLDAGPPLARPRRDRPLAPPVVVTRAAGWGGRRGTADARRGAAPVPAGRLSSRDGRRPRRRRRGDLRRRPERLGARGAARRRREGGRPGLVLLLSYVTVLGRSSSPSSPEADAPRRRGGSFA